MRVPTLAASLLLTLPLHAAVFMVPAGDAPGLVSAMAMAASNMDPTNTIELGGGVYTLTAVDNTNDGPSGLATVTGTKTLIVNGNSSTIERSSVAMTPDFRIFHIGGVAGTVLTLNDLTLVNGSSGATFSGGAVTSSGTGGTPTTALNMNRCTVMNCSTGTDGGAIATRRCVVTLSECEFIGCTATRFGGAIYCKFFGIMTVDDCTFTGNMVTAGGQGGALYRSSNGFGIVTDTFVNRCTFDGNMALGAGAEGGAIFHECFVSTSTRIIEIELCTISNNHADGDGGGLCNFARETCCSGFEAISEMNLTSCTITGNTAGGQGGGFRNEDSGGVTGSRIRLRNTILAGNTATGGGNDGSHASLLLSSQGYNLIGDNTGISAAFPAGLPNPSMDWVGTGATPLDPMLAPLANNGGPTMTHALLSGSDALDNGDPSQGPTDQRGQPRPQGAGVDIGSYEGPPPPVCTLTGPAGTVSGVATLTLDASSPAAPTVDGTFEFSIDGGLTFVACTAAPGSPLPAMFTGLAPGAMDFDWDTLADGVGVAMIAAGVIVRATINDGVTPVDGTCDAAPFDIDNTGSTCLQTCGDCNLSMTGPDILDALTAAQIAAGLIVPSVPQTTCCDVNNSMSVDVLDALGIAQNSAGLPFVPVCP